MGAAPAASSVMRPAAASAAASSSSRPVISTIRRSKSFSCSQALSRRRPGGTPGMLPVTLMASAYIKYMTLEAERAEPLGLPKLVELPVEHRGRCDFHDDRVRRA